MAATLDRLLRQVGVTDRTWVPPHALDAVTEPGPERDRVLAVLESADLVLLDAYDGDRAQDEPSASRLRAFEVLDLLDAVASADRPRTIVYSTSMNLPELRVALAGDRRVDAAYTSSGLADHLADVIHGGNVGSIPPPQPDDWRAIDRALKPGADLAKLHQMMRDNPRAWRLVWDLDAPFDQAAQKWISRQIQPWLIDGEGGTYRVAVDVTRRISGFASEAAPAAVSRA